MNSTHIWRTLNGRAVLAGSPGVGNGMLELGPSRNAAITLAISPEGSFRVKLDAEVSFSEERSLSGLFVGFQAAIPHNNLMHNQSSDRLYVRFNADGQIVMVSAGDGNETQDRSASVPFTNGDRLQVELELGANASVVQGRINNVTRGVASSVSIPFYRGSQLSELAINQTGNTHVKIHSVEIYQLR